jgi:O-antigen/teichoic acid export membrane protein
MQRKFLKLLERGKFVTDRYIHKKIFMIVISNVIRLATGIAVSLLIPKILSVNNYGYYKIFILYLTYCGLFHFGFIDGIYLKYGGESYDRLDKVMFRSYFKYLFILVSILSFLFIALAFSIKDNNSKIIVILLSINLISVHITGYFQMISQITSRFKELSNRIIIIAIGNLVLTISGVLLKIDNYIIYILLIIILNYTISIWYIFTYKDIVFGEKIPIYRISKAIKIFMINGVPLLLANLATSFLLVVDKQIVQVFFTVEKFAIYAFSYSMLSIVTLMISSVGVVLYPILMKSNIENIGYNHTRLNRIVISIVFLGLFIYFPLQYFIPFFLTKYLDSLLVFRITLPGIIFSSSIVTVKHNFFKITNKNDYFFFISLSIIFLSIGLNFIAYYIYGTIESIAISSIIGLSIWYILTEIYMIKIHHTSWIKNSFLILFGITFFYVLTSYENYLMTGIIYLIIIILTIYLLNREEIKNFYYNQDLKV